MKFDLISDFHVEHNVLYKDARTWREGDPVFYAWHKARKNPILVIAGDISNVHEVTMAVVDEAAAHYEQVIWCDGNHDHYAGYIDHTKYSLMQNMERYRVHAKRDNDNVTYLDGEETFQIEGTLFIGANGWYDFRYAHGYHPKQQYREWQQHSNDPVCIRFGKKNKPDKMADRQARQLVKLVEDAQEDDTVKEIVVVTHTVPHGKGLIRDVSHEWYPLNGAYGNMHMIKVRQADKKGKIKTWVFGHTHYLYDYFDGGIHYVANPRGYRGEKRMATHTPSNMVFRGIKEVDTEEPEVKSAFGEVEDDTN